MLTKQSQLSEGANQKRDSQRLPSNSTASASFFCHSSSNFSKLAPLSELCDKERVCVRMCMRVRACVFVCVTARKVQPTLPASLYIEQGNTWNCYLTHSGVA